MSNRYIFYKEIKSKYHYNTIKEVARMFGIYKETGNEASNFVREFFKVNLPANADKVYYAGRHMVQVIPWQDDYKYFNILSGMIKLITLEVEAKLTKKDFIPREVRIDIVNGGKRHHLVIRINDFLNGIKSNKLAKTFTK